MERGTPFALSHTFRQTGPFRPGNVDRAPGLVFVGSGDRARGRGADGAGVGHAGRRAGSGARDGDRDRCAGHARRVVPAVPRGSTKRHGTTYYWSTLALPAGSRHHVWALYAFCRYADDIVDDLGDAPVEARGGAADFGDRFFADLAAGRSDDPVLQAVVHTVQAFGHDPDCFRRFLASMAMDLTVDRYATWDDLLVYMDGSAAVIGEMMLPILEPPDPAPRPGPRPRRGLPAHQLPPRRRRGPRPGAGLPPAGGPGRFGADPARRWSTTRGAS